MKSVTFMAPSVLSPWKRVVADFVMIDDDLRQRMTPASNNQLL